MMPIKENSAMMTNREYFDKCREYSDRVAEKSKETRELLDSDPELSGEGAYEKYWDLHNAATTASLEWVNFCTNNKPSGW
ncbi:hypothetical protein [Pseudomonas sp. RIT623]|uniref:hypothetical protein n=1 Tax=Pseudomonas sp. RIT623 TaxID=2559075 RepID=UPI001070123C|nr:hypothetical protein [Pseudomonas sp. RIT623]TFF38130.1 hypothetical protein E3U47_16940 [Pseudomonas sp. RIT623]